MEDRHCSLADHSKSLQTVRIPIKIKVPLDSSGISVSCQTLSPTHHKSNMLCHAKTLPNLYLIVSGCHKFLSDNKSFSHAILSTIKNFTRV